MTRRQTFVAYSICLIALLSCASPVEYEIGEAVFAHVPFIHIQGGECFQGSAAMIGAAVYGLEPTEGWIARQNDFLGHAGPVSTIEMIRLLRDFWQFDSRVDHSAIGEMYHYLSQGYYILALIDGWQHLRHACVVVGVDMWYVYTMDPVSGERYYTHEEWRRLHQDTRGEIFVIRGGTRAP